MIERNSCSINTWNWFCGGKKIAPRAFPEEQQIKSSPVFVWHENKYAECQSIISWKRMQNQATTTTTSSQEVHEIRERGREREKEEKSVAFDVTNKLKWVHSSGSSSLPQKLQKSKLPRKRKRNFSRVKLKMYDNPITNGFARRDSPLSLARSPLTLWLKYFLLSKRCLL